MEKKNNTVYLVKSSDPCEDDRHDCTCQQYSIVGIFFKRKDAEEARRNSFRASVEEFIVQ